jgi:glycosyltransferase involved in cell wall biosynthesis
MNRVLLVIPSMIKAGGAEKLVNSIAQLLGDTYQVSVASFDPPGTEPFFWSGVPFHGLGASDSSSRWLRVLDYLVAAFKLRALKKQLGCDLTISVLWRADLINALSKGGDRILSLAVINLVDNPTNSTMVRLRWLVGLVYRRFDRVLAIAPGIAKEYCSIYQLTACRVGVFKTFLAPVIPLAVHSGKSPRFVFCARAVHEKNLDGLLAVFAAYTARQPGRQLVVVGDGPLLPEMKSLAVRLGLSISMHANENAQVLFVGSTTKPEDFMAGAIAFLLTSRHEGVPTVAIQAASLGLPLLAADCVGGGMRLLFGLTDKAPMARVGEPGAPAAGLLLPIPEANRPDSIQAWVQAMEIADLDVQQRQRWTVGALELAAGFSPQAVRDDWIATIETVFAG